MQKSPETIQKQYRLIHDIYLMMDYGDNLVFEEFKLTSSQMNILSLIHAKEGQRLTDISLGVFRSKSTITRAVDQLEERDFVARIADPNDRRAQLVVLTDKGLLFHQQVTKKLLVSLDERFSDIDEQEMLTLLDAMSKLRNGLVRRYHAD